MVDGRRVGEPASTIPQPLFFLLSHKKHIHSELFPLLQAVFPDAGIPRAGGQLAGDQATHASFTRRAAGWRNPPATVKLQPWSRNGLNLAWNSHGWNRNTYLEAYNSCCFCGRIWNPPPVRECRMGIGFRAGEIAVLYFGLQWSEGWLARTAI